jgi:hypothetical protein
MLIPTDPGEHGTSRRVILPISLPAQWHFNGQIGTSELTEPATDAILDPYGNGFFLDIEFQDALWAERHAYAASLAPLAVDQEFSQFSLVFPHRRSSR